MEDTNIENLEDGLNNRFQEYTSFKQGGAHYSAMKRLAEIGGSLSSLSNNKQIEWVKRLQGENLTDDFINTVRFGIDAEVKRIRRVLSIGNTWIEEEVLLILTLRIQIDLVLSFFKNYSTYNVTIDLTDIDDKILLISQTTQNKNSFKIAISLMKKNWGLPIVSKWLDLEL